MVVHSFYDGLWKGARVDPLGASFVLAILLAPLVAHWLDWRGRSDYFERNRRLAVCSLSVAAVLALLVAWAAVDAWLVR